MEYKQLNNTSIKISEIVLGCWALGGGYTWGEQDDQATIDTIHTALDLGINTFDTAEFYGGGRSEELLGRGLVGSRDKAVVITKLWLENMTREKTIVACEQSLKRLKTDYIDLYLIHWPIPDVPLEETFGAMEKLKGDGKVRALGVCNFGPRDLNKAISISDIATDQLAYSLLFRAIESEILNGCIQSNVGVLAYSNLAQGLLTGKFTSPEDVDDERARIRFYSKDRPGTVHEESGYESQVFESIGEIRVICDELGEDMACVAVAWILHQKGIMGALVGARTPEQIKGNVKAAQLELSTDVLERLNSATDELKKAMGPNADMWRTASRVR